MMQRLPGREPAPSCPFSNMTAPSARGCDLLEQEQIADQRNSLMLVCNRGLSRAQTLADTLIWTKPMRAGVAAFST